MPRFDLCVVAPVPGRVSAEYRGGFSLAVPHDLSFVDEADVVVVPAFRDCARDTCGTEVLDAIRRAYARGAWILLLGTGAFVLARAGLLDDGRAATHWRHADRMQKDFPAIDVACDALYVQHGRVITSAGTAGAIDAALHLVTVAIGAQSASTIARGMVVPPQRDGGQSKYATGPVVEWHAETLAPLVAWVAANLELDHSLASLAARAHMSERTFARRFKDERGTAPAAWLVSHRVRRAQQLLEGDRPDAGCRGRRGGLRHGRAHAPPLPAATSRRRRARIVGGSSWRGR